ncbi:MAG: hypothetical protein WDA02_10880 [Saccharofermentanales bacterium]
MFINGMNVKIDIGDEVILITDYDVGCGVFTKGHIFKVINIIQNSAFNENKWYDVIDEDGNILKNMLNGNFKKNISFNKSIKIHMDKVAKSKIIADIKSNCSYGIECYDEYDKFSGCKKEGFAGRHTKECYPRLECISYCPKLYKKYPELIRKYKIEKLIYNKK